MKYHIIVTLTLFYSSSILYSDNLSSNAKLDLYTGELQKTYLDIYKGGGEKMKYEELRLKVIDLNYNYLHEKK